MNKNYLAIGILVICFISLIVGILNPKPSTENTTPIKDNTFISLDNPVGDKIALLNIEGVISADAGKNYWSDEFNIDTFISALDKAGEDSRIKAIIIRINSPGGTVAASQDVYDAILRVRTKKPVVVSMADVAASGGYYIASAADRIIAQKGTMTGSIGVIMSFPNIKSLADKVGISSNVIKSGKFKDSGSMYRNMSNDEQKLFQTSVNTAYGQFVSAINLARVNRKDNYKVEKKNLSLDTLKKYADGRVLLGEEAYKLGFVDGLGSMYEARIIASNMAGFNKPLPIAQYNKSGLKSILMGMENKFSTPFQSIMPFSSTHSLQPLMIAE